LLPRENFGSTPVFSYSDAVSDSNQYSLLRQRRFAPFFATQFLGAFNDNIFRNGLIILVTFQGIKVLGMNASQVANVAGALFILPFFLFSAPAGQLADKYEKSQLIRIIKLLEIALMTLAALAFINNSFAALLFVLFLMGCQSTLFGPVKYAYLPQQLATAELIGGNALVEFGTYTAILLGLIVGGISVAGDGGNQFLISVCLIGVAVIGYLSSRGIPITKAADPELTVSWNIWTETWRIVGFAREKKSVFLSIMGISWFWFFGSVITLQIPAYTLDILNGSEQITTALLAAFAVGVGIGSLLCERMSGQRIELGLVPFGSLGMSVFALDLYFAQPSMHAIPVSTISDFLMRAGSWRILIDMAMLGAFAGFYSVPLFAMMQQRSNRQHLSRIIAANNILNAIFMVAAALLGLATLNAGMSIPELFILLAGLNAAVAIYIYTLLPEFLIRFVVWILVNLLYRIRPTGLKNIPESGPAVLVCNHVSFVDALIIGGSIRRPVRFVMHYKIFQIPLLNFLFRTAKAIPIAPASEDIELLRDAFDKINAELESGNLVCIFPEGGITTDGEIQKFRSGIERIIERSAVPVIPIALGGLWGSWFSRRKTGGLRKIPGRLFARINVRIGEAVEAAEANAGNLELLVRTLRGQNR
jgi:1-acyl-sn-glycerol-3-phosphate acyltransferase